MLNDQYLPIGGNMKKFNTAILFIALCVSMVSFFEITSATKNLESNYQKKQTLIQAHKPNDFPRPEPSKALNQKLNQLQTSDKNNIEAGALYIAGILAK